MNYNIQSPNFFNRLVVDTKNSIRIVKIKLKNNSKFEKFMLIKDCIPLRDNRGNVPYYGLQGEDICYLYNYGAFCKNKGSYEPSLSNEERKKILNAFQCYSIIFGEKISSITVYSSEDEINSIEDECKRKVVLNVFNDLNKFDWEPIKNDII